jgi:hypothetical protein
MRSSLWMAPVLSVLFAVLGAPCAHADSVEYTVSGVYAPGIYLNFQYIAPDFITSPGYAPASSLNYCNQDAFGPDESCWYVGFQPDWTGVADLITFNAMAPDGDGGGTNLYFPVGSLSAFGDYCYGCDIPGGAGFYLSVTDVPTPNPPPVQLSLNPPPDLFPPPDVSTPEPSSVIPTSIMLLALAYAARKTSDGA